ncbi:MAG: hypothetical protein C0504_14860 [Candidatus Solibacter sp.]|nr:hypothetical protein [Candidatus Solibacter sp.]
MEFPRFLIVRQRFPDLRIRNIEAAVRRTLDASGMERGLARGSEVAIGAGSRGIANNQRIVRAAAQWWKRKGMHPFIFPAMGSHGAATARGQAEVLAKYGITEDGVGCPVRSSLKVVELGAADGIPVLMDATACAAAGVMLCGRVKWHTDFAGALESGLFKMMAIGLGKFAGAQTYHAHAHSRGLEDVIRTVGRHVLASGKILGGLAIMEDGNHSTAHLEAIPIHRMEAREEELLRLVKTWKPAIPVRELDWLILNEIGKTISGSGMDPKIVNRTIHGAYNPWPDAPVIRRIYLRGLNKDSYGNAVGFGMADVIHARLLKVMKRGPTFVNGITSGALASIRTPPAFGSDREALEKTWVTAGKLTPQSLSIGWIRNTQDLSVMAFSEDLREDLETRQGVQIVGRARRLEFDESGDLVDWL